MKPRPSHATQSGPLEKRTGKQDGDARSNSRVGERKGEWWEGYREGREVDGKGREGKRKGSKKTDRGGFPAQEAQVRTVRPLTQDVCFGSLSVLAGEEEDRGRGTPWAMACEDEVGSKLLRLLSLRSIGLLFQIMVGLAKSRFGSRSLIAVGLKQIRPPLGEFVD